MTIPFVDLQAQYQAYKAEIDLAIQDVLNSSHYIMGPVVEVFERQLSEWVDVPYVITCANGTDALMLALMALDIQPGDEVITSAFSFIAAAEVIAFFQARPVFVDIEADTFNLDLTKLAEKITSRTKAIIPISLFGQPCDMDEINQIAADYSKRLGHKITVIEDAAQSFGAEYKAKKSGNLSEIACTSFFPAKPLGCYGDGGAVFTNNRILAEKMLALRNHGQTERYVHSYIGMNSRLDAIQAAILRVKLNYFPTEVKHRQQAALRYNQLLSHTDCILPMVKDDRTSAYAQYTIRVKNRSKLQEKLTSNGIPNAVHYPIPLHQQPCFKALNYKLGDFPVSETMAVEVLSLPICGFLDDETQQKILSVMNSREISS